MILRIYLQRKLNLNLFKKTIFDIFITRIRIIWKKSGLVNDGPILLFSRGKIDLKNKKIISVVGTRYITIHGTAFCEQLIEQLVPLDSVIISG